MTKANVLYLLIILVIVINFFFPSEINPLIQLGGIYAIFLVYISLKIEVLYLNKKLSVEIQNAIFIFLAILIFLITAVHGVYLSNSRDYFYIFMGYLFLASFIGSVMLKEEWIWRSFKILVFTSSIICMYALAQYLTNFFGLADKIAEIKNLDPFIRDSLIQRLADKRVFAFFSLPTTLAAFLALIMPIVGVLFIRSKGIKKIIMAIILGLHLVILFLTQSYGGILTLFAAVGAVCLLILFNRSKNRLKTIGYVFFLIIIVAGGIYLLGEIRGKLFDFSDPKNPVVLRLTNWKAATNIIKDYPMAGVGLANYKTVYPQYYQPGWQPSEFAHNTYLQIVSDVGIPAGIILFLLFIYWLWMILKKFFSACEAADKNRRQLCTALLMSSFAFLCNNLFEINTYYFSLGIMGIFILALTTKVLNQAKDSQEGIIYNIQLKNHESQVKFREKEATIVLIVLWFIVTGLLIQRFIGLVFYKSASDYFKSGHYTVAEDDIRISKFVDPIDSEYFYLDSRIKTENFKITKDKKEIERAIELAEHSISLNPQMPYLHRNLAYIYIRAGRNWDALREYYKADSLFPMTEEHKSNLEDLKKALTDPNYEKK
ncbi:MAG: O-antigen ligase family protein [Acidobacteria bacterium]|nr:O-antigen ligase family protein [Acidobacteriota bacterium]